MVCGKTFLALLVLIISSQVFAEGPTEDQYWNQTGLNFEIVKNKFRGSCYKTQKDFVACVRALDDAAGLIKPAAVFALDEEVQAGSPIIGALRQDYGPLKLYDYKAVSAKLPAYWPLYKNARDLQIKFASELFAHGYYQKVDFAAILADIKSKILVGKLAGSEGRVSAMLVNSFLGSAVDPHTRIQPLAQIDDNSKSLDVTFVGIGVTVTSSDNQFVVQNPMPNGPAIAAGLRAKDVITSINGEKIENKDLADVTKTLIGPAGTSVKIGLLRKGVPLEIEVVRGTITIPNLQTSWLTDTEKPIGYMRLLSFMETDICQRMAAAISDFQNKGAKGLILDLRGNGGGFMNVAVCVGSLFVGKKVIVKQMDLNGKPEGDFAGESNAITNLPLVTLIDAGSASASEILAGALQDYQRSWLAGDRSYGKASVQAESPWGKPTKVGDFMKTVNSWLKGQPQPKSTDLAETIGIWKTISRFYQPSGRTNQIVGITPDISIDPFPNATEDDKFALREADLYTNALPPMGPQWKELRPNRVAAISSCMNSSGLAKTIYDKKQDDAISPDYRIISGEVLLTCDR